MQQETLFGDKTISSINYNEQEIIQDILYLHAGGGNIDLDCCYSTGNFYDKGLVRPKYKYDKTPQVGICEQAESSNIPLPNESVSVIMFDPPFVISSTSYNESAEGSNIISKRFTAFQSFAELKEMYSGSLQEFYRLLQPNGIVIFKCQDIVSSSKNHFTHCWVMQEAMKFGFYPKDMFILLSKNRIVDGRKQQHARKFHSYFWVFEKKKCRVDYSTCE